jgi:hypothetical protein
MGLFPLEYENNIQHIIDQMAYYQDEGRIRKVNAYGEAASFARTLKAQASISELIENL